MSLDAARNASNTTRCGEEKSRGGNPLNKDQHLHTLREKNRNQIKRRNAAMPSYTRQCIVLLASNNYSYRRIKAELARDSIEVSILAIYRLKRKYRQTNSIEDIKRSGRPQLLNEDQKKMIDEWLHIQRLIWKRSGQFLSKSIIQGQYIKEKLNWICSTPPCCQMIRKKERKKLEFCKKVLFKL